MMTSHAEQYCCVDDKTLSLGQVQLKFASIQAEMPERHANAETVMAQQLQPVF